MKDTHGVTRNRSWFIRGFFGLQTALGGVLTHKLRSSLTVLGVAIGVASLIVLLAIGHGARAAVAEQFESLGTNLIKVASHRWDIRLTVSDPDELVQRVPTLTAGMPLLRGEDVQLKYRRLVTSATMIGVTGDFPEVRDHDMLAGRFFSELHVQERMRVAILGHDAWRRIFGSVNPVGEHLYLDGQRFTIIGVLEPKGVGMAHDIDSQIVVPITAAQRVLLTGRVDELWLKAADSRSVDPALLQTSRILRHQFNIRDSDGTGTNGQRTEPMPMPMPQRPGEFRPPYPGMPTDPEGPPLTITSLNALVQEAGEASRVMTMMLAGIASVALLVGGLGIMNIMLVSVAERTREIGIRKSLGAHPADLVYQFMVEALVLSVLGGAVGIAFGRTGVLLASRYGLETLVTLETFTVAFGAAAGVGILFGVYPAYVAAQLEPVEALRHR